MSMNSCRSADFDGEMALEMARAIARDPTLLERKPEIVTEVAAHPAAREVLHRLFTSSKKVSHRYQRARLDVNIAAFA